MSGFGQATKLSVAPPEGWHCEHGHFAFEHRRCWDRHVADIVLRDKLLDDWSANEIVVLLKYTSPAKRVFQVKDELWRKYHVNRSLEEVEYALEALNVKKDLPQLKIAVGDIEATNLNANFGMMLGYDMKLLCDHDQALGERCSCDRRGRGGLTVSEIKREYGDAYVPAMLEREKSNGHVCHCKEVYRGAWMSEKDTKIDKKLGVRLKDLFVVKKFLHDVRDIDIFIGHNVRRRKGYDLKYVKTRALIYARMGLLTKEEMRPLNYGVMRYIDTLTDAWDNLALHSARQEVLISTFHTGIKTKLDEEAWNEAVFGTPWAITYIRDHCRTDIDACEVNTWLLRPFSSQWPYGRPV